MFNKNVYKLFSLYLIMALFSVGDILLCKKEVNYSRGYIDFKTRVSSNYLITGYIDPDWICDEYVLVELVSGRKVHSFKLGDFKVDDKSFERVGHIDIDCNEKLEELIKKYEHLKEFLRQE